MTRLLLILLTPLRACIAGLQSPRRRVGPLERLFRTLLLLPLFSVLLIVVRVAALAQWRFHVEVTLATGERFRCSPPDLVQLYLWLFGVWEPDATAFVRSRLRPGDVFVDVGANIGYFSVIASSLVGESGRVIAIEAAPEAFAELNRNMAASESSGNVRTVNIAAAGAPGMRTMYSGPAHNTGLTSTVKRPGLAAQSSITARPLDHLIDEQEIRAARLIKIDVEGGEPDVLAGMNRILELCSDELEILVELSPAWWTNQALTPEAVIRPFLDAGFNVYSLPNNYWPWRYLWPCEVDRPMRVRQPMNARVDRLDVVLSRRDADAL